MGVFLGLKASVDYRGRRRGLAGLRVAVQGLGHVGYHLCRLLADEGARLTVSDIRDDNVRRVVDAFDAVAVAPDAVFDADVDVFAPCALGAVINDATVTRLKARIIAGSSNNQLAEARHGAVLRQRGILYAPDYVINAGGIIHVAAGQADGDRSRVDDRIEGIYDTTLKVFKRADRQGIATSLAADRIAEERFRPHRPTSLAA